MQIFHIKKHSAIQCFSLVFSICLLTSYSQAEESQNIHIEWTYDTSQSIPVDGFRLYIENSVACSTSNPAARAMDCDFESPYGTFDFYLSAYSANSEGPLSAPFSFTLQAPTTPEDPTTPPGVVAAELNTNISSGAIPLTVTLDAGNSQGTIIFYMWSFGDGTDDTLTQESHATHTYETVGRYTATVTVIDSDNNTDKKSITIEATAQGTSPEPGAAAPTGFLLLQVDPDQP